MLHETTIMSTVPQEASSPTGEPLANLLFDHPGADIVLRSQDSSLFRVPKIFIINGSPILGELIQRVFDSSLDVNAETSLPVVQLPECGEIFHCLLTFILHITPRVPSAPEDIMELLSVAQKYQMGAVLTHIRGTISHQNALPTGLEPALHSYALAQNYGLQPEAVQAARAILFKHSMAIEDLDNRFDIVPGASLFELLKYHERVRANLALDLTEFMVSCGHCTITGLRCDEYNSNRIPRWFDQYIDSVRKAPNRFDLFEFNTVMARHIKDKANQPSCECVSIPSHTLREFWEALESVVHGSFKKVSVVDIPSRLRC